MNSSYFASDSTSALMIHCLARNEGASRELSRSAEATLANSTICLQIAIHQGSGLASISHWLLVCAPRGDLCVGLSAWQTVERRFMLQTGCWGRWKHESKSPSCFVQCLWGGHWGLGSASLCLTAWSHRPGHCGGTRAALPPSGLPYASDQIEWIWKQWLDSHKK